MDEKKKILVKMTKRSLSNSFENRRKCMKGWQVVAFHHRVGRQIASKSGNERNLTFRLRRA